MFNALIYESGTILEKKKSHVRSPSLLAHTAGDCCGQECSVFLDSLSGMTGLPLSCSHLWER